MSAVSPRATLPRGRAAPAALDLTLRERDGVRIISVRGELDLATAGTLCARVETTRREGCRRLLLDLTQLAFCDSCGLRALIGAAQEVAASAGRLAVIPPVHGPAAHLFALTGAGEFLPLRTTVQAGLAAL